jgi:hypothetical protein
MEEKSETQKLIEAINGLTTQVAELKQSLVTSFITARSGPAPLTILRQSIDSLAKTIEKTAEKK